MRFRSARGSDGFPRHVSEVDVRLRVSHPHGAAEKSRGGVVRVDGEGSRRASAEHVRGVTRRALRPRLRQHRERRQRAPRIRRETRRFGSGSAAAPIGGVGGGILRILLPLPDNVPCLPLLHRLPVVILLRGGGCSVQDEHGAFLRLRPPESFLEKHPKQPRRLGTIFRRPRAVEVRRRERVRRAPVPRLARLSEQLERAREISLRARARLVQRGEVEQRVRVPRVGARGEGVPRGDDVARGSPSVEMQHPDAVMRRGEVRVRGASEELTRAGVIQRDAHAPHVHVPEVERGGGVARVGGVGEGSRGCGFVARHPSPDESAVADVALRLGNAPRREVLLHGDLRPPVLRLRLARPTRVAVAVAKTRGRAGKVELPGRLRVGHRVVRRGTKPRHRRRATVRGRRLGLVRIVPVSKRAIRHAQTRLRRTHLRGCLDRDARPPARISRHLGRRRLRRRQANLHQRREHEERVRLRRPILGEEIGDDDVVVRAAAAGSSRSFRVGEGVHRAAESHSRAANRRRVVVVVVVVVAGGGFFCIGGFLVVFFFFFAVSEAIDEGDDAFHARERDGVRRRAEVEPGADASVRFHLERDGRGEVDLCGVARGSVGTLVGTLVGTSVVGTSFRGLGGGDAERDEDGDARVGEGGGRGAAEGIAGVRFGAGGVGVGGGETGGLAGGVGGGGVGDEREHVAERGGEVARRGVAAEERILERGETLVVDRGEGLVVEVVEHVRGEGRRVERVARVARVGLGGGPGPGGGAGPGPRPRRADRERGDRAREPTQHRHDTRHTTRATRGARDARDARDARGARGAHAPDYARERHAKRSARGVAALTPPRARADDRTVRASIVVAARGRRGPKYIGA